jgi:hypothetical protein
MQTSLSYKVVTAAVTGHRLVGSSLLEVKLQQQTFSLMLMSACTSMPEQRIVVTPCRRSLENTSSSIRWSLDLRWQHPDLPDGAYGLKRSVRMTSPGDASYVIPWEGWADVDKKTGAAAGKQQQQEESKVNNGSSEGSSCLVTPAAAAADGCGASAVGAAVASGGAAGGVGEAASPLSTVLVGPWLDLWPITHENKHTRAWQAMKQAGN